MTNPEQRWPEQVPATSAEQSAPYGRPGDGSPQQAGDLPQPWSAVQPGHSPELAHRSGFPQQPGHSPGFGPGPQPGHPPQPGQHQPGHPQSGYPQQIVVSAPKSAGVAVLLSLLWFGAGHLYANNTAVGVALIVYDVVLAIFALSFFGLVIAIPAWVISLPIVMITAANAANDYNRRNGIMVR